MSTDLRSLKDRMRECKLSGEHAAAFPWVELARLIYEIGSDLLDDGGGGCTTCSSGCSPGCQPGCSGGCLGGQMNGP